MLSDRRMRIFLYAMGQRGKDHACTLQDSKLTASSFSADSPYYGSTATDDVNPANPTTGRDNNHGEHFSTTTHNAPNNFLQVSKA